MKKYTTFKVAKAIKEAGYPQNYNNAIYSEDNMIHINITDEYRSYLKENQLGYDAPTYLDVWLWLWREKKKSIDIIFNGYSWESSEECEDSNDPEEAIIAAIEYLVDNNLIK